MIFYKSDSKTILQGSQAPMTLLYYCFFYESLPSPLFDENLNLCSKEQYKKISKFIRWQDAHASLFGNMMLLKGLRKFGLRHTLDDIQYNGYGKPFLKEDPVQFNISHAGACVTCILSNDTSQIGIDVEEIKEINVADFKNIWTENEWNQISSGDLSIFYQFWTRKEAIVKAEGKGLSIPLNEISIQHSRGTYGDKLYFLEEVKLQPEFVLTIASRHEITELEVINVQPLDIVTSSIQRAADY